MNPSLKGVAANLSILSGILEVALYREQVSRYEPMRKAVYGGGK